MPPSQGGDHGIETRRGRNAKVLVDGHFWTLGDPLVARQFDSQEPKRNQLTRVPSISPAKQRLSARSWTAFYCVR